MLYTENLMMLAKMLMANAPKATAAVSGNGISGRVDFYETGKEVIVMADISGLPKGADCSCKVFAFHIHEGTSCGGADFAETMGHYNPDNCPHPCHAGDMPPLFGNDGNAWMAFATNRFTVDEIIGKTVVIHEQADDFTTQPAGNAGKKIACGVIKKPIRV